MFEHQTWTYDKTFNEWKADICIFIASFSRQKCKYIGILLIGRHNTYVTIMLQRVQNNNKTKSQLIRYININLSNR